MHRTLLVALVAAAAGIGWLVGSAARGGVDDQEADRLRGEVARMRRALGERGPVLQPQAGGLRGLGDPAGGTGGPGPSSRVPERLETWDPAAWDGPDVAFQALLAYARTQLTAGPEGHLALLETLGRLLREDEGGVEALLGGEGRAARYLYPVLRFALHHDAEVAAFTETVLRTMATEPGRLAQVEDRALELVTGRLALLLPGMLPTARLDRAREHLARILATPLADQPLVVQRRRRDVQRALEAWRPPMGPEEAAMRLRAGASSPEEALGLLERLRPGDVANLDLDALVGPLLERDGWRVVPVLLRLQPDAATVVRLDQRVVRGVKAGTVPQSFVAYWLRNTGREGWPAARGMLEAGLQQGDEAARGVFVMTALGLEPPPPEDWVTWAERTYELPSRVRLFLKQRREDR